MELCVKTIEINWNWGLGISPISVFIYLSKDDTYGKATSNYINTIYDSIKSIGIKDIIFYGDFSEVDTLNWLTVRLLSDGYFVSVIIKATATTLNTVMASRVILYLELDDIRQVDLSGLTESDYIIINEAKINRVLATISRLSGLGIRIGRLYFNTELLSRENALNGKLFDIYPYDGINLS